jgi:hypothetical protein
VNFANNLGTTLLIIASHDGHVDVVRVLLKNSADRGVYSHGKVVFCRHVHNHRKIQLLMCYFPPVPACSVRFIPFYRFSLLFSFPCVMHFPSLHALSLHTFYRPLPLTPPASSAPLSLINTTDRSRMGTREGACQRREAAVLRSERKL